MKTECFICDICKRQYSVDVINYDIFGMLPRYEGLGYIVTKNKYATKHICRHCIDGIVDNIERVKGCLS